MNDPLLNIKGVCCAAVNAGIKNNDDLDLSVISLIEGSETAAVFTQKIF
jgi:glutamate N-acetyltransferase/amino-acid N-acetyltransferase